MNIIEFIKKTPKAELHLHIEGTLEPDHMFLLAKRNNIQIKKYLKKIKIKSDKEQIKQARNTYCFLRPCSITNIF